MEIVEVLKSWRCWIVIFLSSLAGFYLVRPVLNFYISTDAIILSALFISLFSVSVACLVRSIKISLSVLKTKESVAGIIGYIIGILSLQSCVASGVCVQTFLLTFMVSVLPGFLVDIFMNFGKYLLLLSSVLIAYSLKSMGCFRKQGKVEMKFTLSRKLK